LIAEGLKRGFSENDMSQQALLGPVWLDTVYTNAFLRSVGATTPGVVASLKGVYGRAPLKAVASMDQILLRGSGDDPRHEALVVLTEAVNGISIKRPDPERPGKPVIAWLRDGGVYAAIRVFSETDPTRDNLGLQKSTDPSAVRFEVVHMFTALYYMPVGTSIVYEAKWVDGRWELRELGRKIS
jgi:hypothetical protein